MLLDDVLVDFPFLSASDRAHALAALLIPFVKPMIRGVCPIHLIEAPAIGSGKSLLAKLVHLIAAGASAPMTTMGRDEEETRKKITSLLAAGARIVIVDNVVDGVSSSNLAAAVTSEVWKDRWLGTQEMPELPNNAIWFFTGNNPDLSLEIARRCIRIRIESPDEKPWLRRDFKHDPIEDWVAAHRPELVRAILVLIQAWVNDGARLADVTMGSFQPWARTMGGILEFLGIPGFLENRNEMFETVDPQENEWRAFVSVWWDRFGGLPVLATALRALAEQNDMLAACLGTKSESSQTVRLGKELRRLRGRRFGHLRIALCRPGRDKANRWSLVPVSDGHNGPSDDFPFGDASDDRGANVTDLFGAVDTKERDGSFGVAARRVEPEARRVNEQPSAAESSLAGCPRRVAEGADSDPGVTQRARTGNGRARTHVSSACAHNVREVPINPPHPPRPSADQLESASAARRVGGNTLRESPINPPRVDDEADSLDLLHIPETSSEYES